MNSDFPASALIIDDHPLYSEALSVGLVGLNPKCRITLATDTVQARQRLDACPGFDLVMLDLILQGASGLSLLTELRDRLPQARIIVVSSREESGVVDVALAMGADGFIGKSAAMPQIVDALRRMSMGVSLAPLTQAPSRSAVSGDRLAGLSQAQMRTLVALADGRLNKQIAYDLGLAEPTVKSHLSAIFKKLGVANRTQAILVARALFPEAISNTEIA